MLKTAVGTGGPRIRVSVTASRVQGSASGAAAISTEAGSGFSVLVSDAVCLSASAAPTFFFGLGCGGPLRCARSANCFGFLPVISPRTILRPHQI
jgi:hypothetical protein